MTTNQVDDKKFISNPNKWPNWPFLPVKRYIPGKNGPECGLLIDGQSIEDELDPEHKSVRTIYLINMFALPETDIEKAEKKEYESVEKMLIDGWIVD